MVVHLVDLFLVVLPMPCPDDQVIAVRRAVDVLNAFSLDDTHLSMAELVRRTALAKTTVLRLVRTLEACGFLVQTDNGAWRIGPAAAWLGARYQVSQHLRDLVYPVLRGIYAATGRNTSFFVREHDSRVRLMSVEGDPDKWPSQVGEALPLDRGSAGKVILAFMDRKGRLFDEIRGRGWHITINETRGRAASLAAPVFGAGWSVVGAIAVSCASKGASEDILTEHVPLVTRAARELSSAIMRAHHGEKPAVHRQGR